MNFSSPDHETSNVSIKVDIKPSRSSSGKIAAQHNGSGRAEVTSDERIPPREPTKDDMPKTPEAQSPFKGESGKEIDLKTLS